MNMNPRSNPGIGTARSSSSLAIATSSMTTSSGKRIQREMMELNTDHPPDCSAGPKGDNLYLFTFIGPADNPLVPGIAHLYLADTAKHDDLVAEWTLRFAK